MKFSLIIIILLVTQSLSSSGMLAQEQSLVTRWTTDVTPDNALPEYPRPQMVRDRWLNLNGRWEYATTTLFGNSVLTDFGEEILVPFPIESALSGVQQSVENKRLVYRRKFTIPEDWAGQRILLHFGAIDWEAKVWVNDLEIGSHRGGYDAFSFDITHALHTTGVQELSVDVWDPTDLVTQPRGKQVRSPNNIWYTSTTGIWQTVWLEPVPTAYITGLKMVTDIDAGMLKLQADLNENPVDTYMLKAEVRDSGEVITMGTGVTHEPLEIIIDNPQLWSPDSPFLYDLRITLMDGNTIVDQVMSYFGMRKIAVELGEDNIPRLYLNNQPLFQFGLLDQGFWPDGLYTAPTDEALRHDIEVTRQLGFNLIRKHVKVEPERWYYWADKLGVLVWQDMPSGDAYVDYGEGEIERSEKSAAQFELELQRMIDTHSNHPSIVMWVIFNEGWGQYDTERLTDWLKDYDPTRLVNSASGWNNFGTGDVYDIHSYPGPDVPEQEAQRAAVLGEFGGLGLPIQGHTWLPENNWGYVEYDDPEALLLAYTDLIDNLRQLIETRGLAAAVYTQTTDVEIEVNGMMTYDRAMTKLDAQQVRAINNTLYSAITH
jgi:beta-galactosidase/beta-glucuronidase